MKIIRKIEQLVEKFCAASKSHTKISPEMDERTLNDSLSEYDKSMKINPASAAGNVRRITKFATAAVIVIAVTLGVNLVNGPGTAGAVWGDVVSHISDVDYVHMYIVKSRGTNFFGHGEAWHAHGKTVIRGNDGGVTYDDGRMLQHFDGRGMLTVRKPSILANGQSFLEFFSGGFLSDKDEQFNALIPTSVGDDFLIYTFDPQPGNEWLETTSITVGRNSLLPIQMKIYVEDENYDLFVFDYEAPEKPPEFFEPPAVATPNGTGQVVLDGAELAIDIENAPGLGQAIVRLHARYDGPAEQFPLDYVRGDGLSQEFCQSLSEKLRNTYERRGGPIFRCEVTFVTDEGYRSGTNRVIVLRLNEAKQCGVGSASGSLDDWPDGKYRNIRFSPLLRPTDTEDTYTVEMRCRVGTKTD